MAAEKHNQWELILYPENMRDDWEEVLEDYIPYPYAYCIHDKDTDDADEGRKTHVHMLIVSGSSRNRTTLKHAQAVGNRLAKENRICCPRVAPVYSNMRRAYEYLIHNTDKAREQGKYQYSPDERKTGNGFDIGMYETISDLDRLLMVEELCDMCIELRIRDMASLYNKVKYEYPHSYMIVLKGNYGFIDRIVRGVYHQEEERRKKEKEEQEDI